MTSARGLDVDTQRISNANEIWPASTEADLQLDKDTHSIYNLSLNSLRCVLSVFCIYKKMMQISRLILCAFCAACGADADENLIADIAARAESILNFSDRPCYVLTADGDENFLAFHRCLVDSLEIAGPQVINQRLSLLSAPTSTFDEFTKMTGAECRQEAGAVILCQRVFAVRLRSFFRSMPPIIPRRGPCWAGRISYALGRNDDGEVFVQSLRVSELRSCRPTTSTNQERSRIITVELEAHARGWDAWGLGSI